MNICPWCGKDSFSFWQVQTLGPGASRKCPHCAHAVRASWPSAFASLALLLIPVLSGIIMSHAMPPDGQEGLLFTLAGFLVGGVLSMAWTHRFSRLVRAGGAGGGGAPPRPASN